jgi:hypothetical protein
MRPRLVFAALPILAACMGSTGSDLITFQAFAAGPADANGELSFSTERGYRVTLTRAVLHVGAIYLNAVRPIAVARPTSCVLPGTYVAEITYGLDVDLLSPALQAFPVEGEGIVDDAVTGEIWLTGGDVNAADDSTVILDAEGVAARPGEDIPFEAKLTIGKNRAIVAPDPALPGSNPMCQQRIVSPIPIGIRTKKGGTLLLRIDPRPMFRSVEFRDLPSSAAPERRRFEDKSTGQPSVNLYNGLRANSGVYSFEWR